MKSGLVGGLLVVLGCAAMLKGDDVVTVKGEDAKLNNVFKAYLEKVFQAEPLTATRLGDHRFDDQLDDLSAEARAANVERDRKALSSLPEQVDYARLSRDGQIDFEIFRQHLERSIWLAENFKPFEDDPRIYGDYLTDSVYLPLSQSTQPRALVLKNLAQRMEKIPGVVKVARKTIKNPPKVKVETAIRQTQGAIDFYKTGLFELAAPNPQAADSKGLPALRDQAKPIVEALGEHMAFLKGEVLPRSNDDWRIGRERFAKKLELELDAGLTAVEVFAEAESEALRVEREMALIARVLWSTMFPKAPVPPDDELGRRLMTRRVLEEIAKDHGTPDSLVNDARATVDAIKTFIKDKDVITLPEPDRLRIIEMPEFKRGNSVAYLESAPPLDPLGASEYAISPPPSDWTPAQVKSFLGEYNSAMLKILTIHEAYPGHYVQLEYSNKCPSLIRRVLQSGTFAEGWAVYTEQMMLDQGFGGGDLKLRLQQLKFYLRAVVNAILDHKMHCEHMTDDEARELLMGRAFQTEGEALGKIIRAKQSSVQLSTYFVGRTAFYRLRQSLQREQGERFNLGRYHEAALAHGTLPVKYLPELVRKTLGNDH
ncbi:MAG: DUF885 domain-containing protein [Isosphaeraceae bacterium]